MSKILDRNIYKAFTHGFTGVELGSSCFGMVLYIPRVT